MIESKILETDRLEVFFIFFIPDLNSDVLCAKRILYASSHFVNKQKLYCCSSIEVLQLGRMKRHGNQPMMGEGLNYTLFFG